MKQFCLPIAALLFLNLAGAAQTADLRENYVGKSSCRPGLEEKVGKYGVRLDKKQIARLEARTSGGKKLLMIVQYNKQWDDCGIVRDIIQASAGDISFIYDCVDESDPGAVVVGTWRTPKISGLSLQSWRVELTDLKFVPMVHRLKFTPDIGQGSDDGSDLADWAKTRAARRLK